MKKWLTLVNSIPRPVRFLIVGILNTGFSYFIYAATLYAGLPYAAANLVACLVGIAFSFKTQGRLVFGDAKNPKFWKFVSGWLVLYLINIALIKFFVGTGFNAYVAGALALPIVVVISYFVQRIFVFKS